MQSFKNSDQFNVYQGKDLFHSTIAISMSLNSSPKPSLNVQSSQGLYETLQCNVFSMSMGAHIYQYQ